jgi:phosphatidylserine decarboxylase
MATLDTPAAESLTPANITCVQPGGGFCLKLERAWGKLRRHCLRRFWPQYVQRIRDKRLGECANCPHDIVDARDLKLYRNVCGYRFAPEDDPFRYREHLRLARPGLCEIVLASVLCMCLLLLSALAGVLLHWVFFVLAPVALALWLFVLSFFRDPQRAIPTDPGVLVSPADGTITQLETVADKDFPGGRAYRISIFLSVFNVHVNRVPRAGKVLAIRYFPGEFLDARSAACAVRNEQLWIDLEDSATQRVLRVKQISGAIARRIVCWLRPGDILSIGERFGMIKFGSRTDILWPVDQPFELKVKIGDKVKGGSTVLAKC